MTLVALWSTDGEIQLASDSRLTVCGQYVDTSVKVTSLPITILHPSSAGLDGEKVSLRQSIGVCAAGDLAPTLAVKDSLRTLLARTWPTPGIAEISMRTYAEIAATFLKPIWYAAASALGNDTAAVLVVVGYCPKERRQRAFVLSTNATESPASIDIKEIVQWERPYFFGSGRRCAESVWVLRPSLTPLEVIEAVCSRKETPTVGGRVQYGRVVSFDFEVFAVFDLDVNQKERSFVPGYYFAGVEIMNASALALPDGIELLPKVIAPFETVRRQLLSEGYNSVQNHGAATTLIDSQRAHDKRTQLGLVTK